MTYKCVKSSSRYFPMVVLTFSIERDLAGRKNSKRIWRKFLLKRKNNLHTLSSYCRTVKLSKLHDVKYHFIESVLSGTSASLHIIQSKSIFLNRHFAECLFTNRYLGERKFHESSFCRTSFCRKCIERNKHHYSIKM